jgi:hypothetical protein
MLAPLKIDDIFLCLTCLPLTFVAVALKSKGPTWTTGSYKLD